MKKELLLIYVLLTIVLLISCNNSNDELINEELNEQASQSDLDPEVCFEYLYINYKGDSSVSQWIIDAQGNVRICRDCDSVINIEPVSSTQDIEVFDSIVYVIMPLEFEYYSGLISKVDTLNTAGGTVFNDVTFESKFYFYSVINNYPVKIMLGHISDRGKNWMVDSDAIEIREWMEELNNFLFVY